MKIAVMGMGVAGSYLMARLKDSEHEVTGYERMTQIKHDSICAWGTIKPVLEEFCKKAGRNFDDYLIHDGKSMHVRMSGGTKFDIGLKGLCTYDKLRLIKDFISDCNVRYGSAPRLEELESQYDMIVDCTGFHRSYLPKMSEDFFLPTYEYKVEYDDGVPYDDFYIEPFPGMSGYFWYFPLGEKSAHIGAGDYNKNHIKTTDAFLKKHGGRAVQTKGRPIRLATPDRCKPYYSGKVVGVGESIGTVYALLGEGIIPSMQCVELFIENMHDFAAYERAVERHYAVYAKVFKFVRAKIRKDFSIIKSLPDFLAIFRYMKKHEDRFGMKIKMTDLLKVARA
ncbi:MAG: NAD(P)/FAD-dependent oxidoreductase [Nitrosopumilus sp. B06]|nr:MAG: NAD(P)/FAD-dependent oxidoreductase [Nitrosopumilus sp. D6]RNJ79158.1 MAG: NAD(P)/FAD-dependent oxidoreductase [Nitrosopumilus sp. B06]